MDGQSDTRNCTPHTLVTILKGCHGVVKPIGLKEAWNIGLMWTLENYMGEKSNGKNGLPKYYPYDKSYLDK